MENYIVIYAIVPKHIYETKLLTPEEKLIAERIIYLCKKEGYCWITNKKLSEMYNITIETASRHIKKIERIGLIKCIYVHNDREKKAYDSNPDIDITRTSNNIEIIPLNNTKYVKKFYEITKEYRKEHDERMKTERSERKKIFNQMLNNSQNVVADNLEFNMTNLEYVKNLDRDDLIKFGNVCKDFVIKDLGYKPEQIIQMVMHNDETTPHVHCTVVPLVRKYDKRTNTERYTISILKIKFIYHSYKINSTKD